ncbi:SbcC/MukB-like Walker B domain-containing protein [Pantoea sp. B65]|uniref:SbcC/MukB-like Walker B domain-containing protein n=1 Tax=Pantoea sp. B65 TaxID=2813359 RepID=UPI0039B62A5B
MQSQTHLLERLRQLEFEDIDVPGAQLQLAEFTTRLENLLRPESDTMAASHALEEAQQQQSQLEQQFQQAIRHYGGLEKSLEEAMSAAQKYRQMASVSMSDAQRELAASHFPSVTRTQLRDIPALEREQGRELQKQLDEINAERQKISSELIKRMSDAQRIDTGALSETGRELEDVPAYLKRLQELTEEALPEKLHRFTDYLNRSSDEGVTQLLSHIEHEVLIIEDRLNDLNNTMLRVDFQPDRYLRLVAKKVIHESLRTLQRAQRQLNAARFADDNGESQYKALRELVDLLKDAGERSRTQSARALLDPRFRLEFAVSVIDRTSGEVIETRTGSQGGSGGEKEIIASYVLTASLSYALCPSGSSRPLFGTIILDEAFSRSSHAVAGRIIAALKEFGLHAVFITPNKEMRLLRHHTRSAIVVHRREQHSNIASLSWEELEHHYQRRSDY